MKLLEKKQKKNEEKTWKIDFFLKKKKRWIEKQDIKNYRINVENLGTKKMIR
jgi:hypothetical protein